MPALWLTTSDAARRLQVTARYVRTLARDHVLAATRTPGGQWIFRLADVTRLVSLRADARGRTRQQVLRAVRPRMLRAMLVPRQLSLLPRLLRLVGSEETGERSVPHAEVKAPELLRKRA